MKVLLLFLVLLPSFLTAQIYLSGSGLTTSGSGTGTSVKLGGALVENAEIDLGSSFKFILSKSAIEFFSVLNNGNIGIGVSNPTQKLHVAGNILAGSGEIHLLDNWAGIKQSCLATHLYNACGSAGYITMGFNPTTSANTSAADPLTIQQSNLSVGINRSNPLAKLHIVGDGNSSASSSILIANSDNTELFRVYNNGQANIHGPVYATNYPAALYFSAGADNNEPTLSLYRTGSSGWQKINMAYGVGGDPQAGLWAHGSGEIRHYASWGGWWQTFWSNGGEAMRLSLNRNLLVGTETDQGYRLDVSGSARVTGAMYLSGLTNDNTRTRILVSDINGALAYRDVASLAGSGSSGNWTTAGNNIYNLNPGSVTIGTDILPAGDAKLAVKGNIYAQKLKVTMSGWSDYVFENTYKLLPLAELEKFILQNHHLPEVPSASEVQKNGLDVGENQATLLKKIEELTLYILSLNKKIEVQQKKDRATGNKK